ncbi:MULTISPECIES: inositol 2-dehydrogenase [unclassified Ruegeria]|uniref:inositol 2-dehydrogenase n=1 Tax=unclassified Ruegeria TaxID=2625375 RepID=UPI001488EBC1|nr:MULTISPECIES: inositol 2-dehydrogenase [unclassified Ruegeria]NOD47853.1 inositol 2-dehydrogenase [Ruegeria sp. HKCCD5849]NOD52837.1 inositol 2-dehydrogenase [Ruegeria sp. HKCCD5851]NOD68983.1 inositol 2-dehydrogenase [Ruegeria sp. HKCCD7303]NOE35320.1 inositol 2-dehydrogenase [Ruegeria sp. HKCCD7318]
MLKVGLLGAGRIGRVHAQAISAHSNSKLCAVSDAVPEAAESLANEYGAQARGSDEIIADPQIDAVLIATPTDTHSDLIETATAAGKAVLCEKPVDLSLDRAVQCLKTVSGRGKPVMIGFNRRFDPHFSALKESLEAGEVGTAELLSITSFDPAPPPVSYVKVSGGLFRDMMIHDFDMANFLMGDVPHTISAVGSSLVDAEIGAAGDVDTAVVTMTYADGRIAVIKNSRRAAYGYDQRVELLGSKGLLQVHNALENTVVKSTAEGVVGAKPTYFFLERYMPAYRVEWAAFVKAVANGSDVPVSLKDGVAALAMAEAATLSMHSGKPVRMEEVLKPVAK